MSETLLFWAMLFAFLIADNIVSLAHSEDFLSITRKGHPLYQSRQRNVFSKKTLIVLNPVNLFDRGVIAQLINDEDDRHTYRSELKSIRRVSARLNLLAYWGYIYLAFLSACAYFSFAYSFEAVVIFLLLGHFFHWCCAAALVWFCRKDLGLAASGVAVCLMEALFVPAYLVNLNKKLLRLKHTPICSLRLHIRKLKFASSPSKELMQYELGKLLHQELENSSAPDRRLLLKGFLKCLTN
jgi:hypothetical protein